MQISSQKSSFQSTLPARRATAQRQMLDAMGIHFNPRSPHGERPMSTPGGCTSCHFNPRSPHGERPHLPAGNTLADGFQSTLPARGATDLVTRMYAYGKFQSTLPARGATHMSSQQIGFFMLFQSTLPARGATVALLRGAHGGKHFNPRSPHGERHGAALRFLHISGISIHAPRTGSDSPPAAGFPADS